MIKELLKRRDEFCVVDLILGSLEIEFGIDHIIGVSDRFGRAGNNLATRRVVII